MSTWFPDCPACLDENPAKATCGECGGTGQRLMTRENLELAISAWEWAREHLQDALDDHTQMASGDWAPDLDEVSIYRDISFSFKGRADHIDQHFSMPIDWALLPVGERKELKQQGIAARIRAATESQRRRAERDRQDRMAELERELQKLRNMD